MSENNNNSQQSAAVLLVDELFSYCRSDSLSEEGLRELIARHELTPNNNQNLLSNYEFFLQACWNERVTQGIIQTLLEYFPAAAAAAATATDEDRQVPLHCACDNKNVTLDIIKLLIDSAPDTVRSVTKYSWTPLNNLCDNEEVDEIAGIQILKLLIEKYPQAARHVDDVGDLPIHLACVSRSLEFCQVLIDAAPDSVHSVNYQGYTPLHYFCDNREDDDEALRILKLFIEKYPEAVRHADNRGNLPIHLVNGWNSPEFYHVLVEAYPGSMSMPDAFGELPLHHVCLNGSVAAVEFLYRQYPAATDYAATRGYPILLQQIGAYPIHKAISSIQHRDSPAAAVEIVQFLLGCNPDQKLIQFEGKSLLHYACGKQYNSSNVEAGIEMIKVLFDVHPEAISSVCNEGHMPLHILCYNRKVDEAAAIEILKFLLEKHPDAARHANDEGDLPIHIASVMRAPDFCRVLIEAYPGSELMFDAEGALPLHRACFKGSLATVEFLYHLNPDSNAHTDTGRLYPIHKAISYMKHRNDPTAAVAIAQFLLDCDPEQKLRQFKGMSLLHFACGQQYNDSNVEASIQMIKVIFSAHPASARSEDNNGRTPLHTLCDNSKLDEAAALQILKLFIEKYPGALRHANNNGLLPIHIAAGLRSPEFCRVLIEAYPGSERRTSSIDALPLHYACSKNSLATVEYFYHLYPEAIDTADRGFYPIHAAIQGTKSRSKPADAVKIVQFLLDCDPDQKLKQLRGRSPLRYACGLQYIDSNTEAAIQIIKIIFDAHPEAIEDNGIAQNIHHYHQQIQAFINGELVYVRQANDHRLITTPDDNGRLPLHTALQNNVRLGSIKLLMKGNPSAIRSIDDSGELPLHVACEHHDSASVVQYILSLARITRDATDSRGNTALHYACRGAKHDTIAMLLEKYDAASVSKRNADDKLPIDLLWESNEVRGRESLEYTESVFQLLRAYPELVQSVSTSQ